MTFPIVWLPEAEAELRHARDWYDTIRPALGDRFALAVEETIEAVASIRCNFQSFIVAAAARECGAFPMESSLKFKRIEFW